MVGVAAVCECFLRLPFTKHIKILSLYTSKSFRVILSKRISDHWKEVILPLFAAKILCASLLLLLLLLLSFSPLALLHYLAAQLNQDLFTFTLSSTGMAMMTAVAFVYLLARNKIING